VKAIVIKPVAHYISRQIRKQAATAIEDQESIFQSLIKKGSQTAFGKDHQLSKVKTHDDFCQKVPIRDYEGLKSYFDQVKDGAADILWPGKPRYLAKTSGTTSGIKYIPITDASISNHIHTARNALLNLTSIRKDTTIFNGKMIFLSGSPTLSKVGGINTGRLSGIVNHEIPAWVKGNQLPSYETNCIEEWESKLEAVVKETHDQDLRVISGIPPWVQMYFEKLISYTGKATIKDIFPNLSLFVYGGVNYEPYRNSIESLIGERIDTLETYPASEGFIAYQDRLKNDGLLLNTRSGILFEFVPADQIFEENPERFTLAEVELSKDYAIIINSNAGLWGYNLGDTVRFTSLDPYKIVVSGRIKHFISAFGEHVIAKEVEAAISIIGQKHKLRVNEFTVAPMVNPSDQSLPYHEWIIEFQEKPADLTQISRELDEVMTHQNIYYQDLIAGNILRPLEINAVTKGTFQRYMESLGKLGGQNKVPRLSNDRKIADLLLES